MAKAQVQAEFTANTTGFKRGVKEMESQVSHLRNKITSSMRGALNVGGGIALAGAGAIVATSIRKGMRQALSQEQGSVILKSMLGETSKVHEVMKNIAKENRENPMFSKTEMLEASVAMAALADKNTPRMEHLLNVAQKLFTLKPSAGLMGAAEAIRDALGGKTERLKEFAFSGGELSKMKQGNGDMLAKLEKALSEKGITEMTLQEMANTSTSAFAQMENAFTDMGQKFAEALKPQMTEWAKAISAFAEENGPEISRFGMGVSAVAGAVANGAKYLYRGVDSAMGSVADGAVGWWNKQADTPAGAMLSGAWQYALAGGGYGAAKEAYQNALPATLGGRTMQDAVYDKVAGRTPPGLTVQMQAPASNQMPTGMQFQ